MTDYEVAFPAETLLARIREEHRGLARPVADARQQVCLVSADTANAERAFDRFVRALEVRHRAGR